MKDYLKKINFYLRENIKEFYFEIAKISGNRWQYIFGFGNKEIIFYFTYKLKINNKFGIILHTNQILDEQVLNSIKEELKWLDIQSGQILDIERQLKMLKEEEFFQN
ncbi:MAG TPA: hypothetical protein EYH39_03270 [Desulfurobacteriaceae bacterium]|nr:hypothetical protein [Desulfurobacteriaceae bacterium]